MGRRIWQRHLTLWTALANTLGAVGLALFGGLISSQTGIAISCLILGAAFLTFTPVLTKRVRIRHEEQLRALTLFAELTHVLIKIDKEHDPRVTVLVVDTSKKPTLLVQVARFDSEGHQTPSNSSMTMHQGVAGRCYREGRVFAVDFAADRDFTSQMLKWGFTKPEAQEFRERGAFLCAPIFGANDEVIGVLSIDAKTQGVFASEHTDVAERLTPFFGRLLTEPGRKA